VASRTLDELLQAVLSLLAEQSGPISIRHLFYLTVGVGAVEKTERGYQNLKHQLAKWRRSGAINWTAFSDSTRWYYGHAGHAGPRIFLEETIRTYRYNLWATEDAHVEIWAEKDAIASILLEAADPWRVQVFPFRGFASLTSLYNAAETHSARGDSEPGEDAVQRERNGDDSIPGARWIRSVALAVRSSSEHHQSERIAEHLRMGDMIAAIYARQVMFPAGATGYVGAIPGGKSLVLKIFGCAPMMRISPVDAERKLIITGLQEEDAGDEAEGGE
jgi:hypothetical protein